MRSPNEKLGTGERFVRRLITERRIRYVKLGRPVRIPRERGRRVHRRTHVQPLRRIRARYGKAA